MHLRGAQKMRQFMFEIYVSLKTRSGVCKCFILYNEERIRPCSLPQGGKKISCKFVIMSKP